MNLHMFLLALSCLRHACCESSCEAIKTCGECIGHGQERCMWCSQEKIMTQRCQLETYSNSDWCEKKFLKNPTKNITVETNKNFSSIDSDSVQFRPQKIKIKASPGVDANFTVSYKPAKDFPLDVYFLMDFTLTMKNHRKALRDQSTEIFNGLQKLTKAVRMGVGSFIEKPALPYVDINTKGAHYSYKNLMNLSMDMTAFTEAIKPSDRDFGSNYDDPEAGLDALMQVMKCDKILGWRNDARKIILLVTDNTYHSAGDGKMVGAIKPNDMKCHLENDEYKDTFSLKYDYPSVSQINRAAHDGHFKIIFAGLEQVKNVYEPLSSQIMGSEFALFQENSNILEIIKKAYQELEANVKIDYMPRENFEITIDQQCDKNKELKNCQFTPKDEMLEIPVIIKRMTCSDQDEISIYPRGLNESLTVTFEVDCKCDCEMNVTDLRRLECNDAGSVLCGSCKCDKQKGGDKCQFNCSDNDMKLKESCYQDKSTIECSNHGNCLCGICDCEGDYTGKFCEFSPDSCNKAQNGKICAGRGLCRNGICECNGPWIGDDCDCPIKEKSLQQCTDPFSKKVCSNRGNCDCGRCHCSKDEKTNKLYSGIFCESCDECAAQRCDELKEYAKCNHNNTVDVCNNLFNMTSNVNVNVLVAKRSHLRQLMEWKTGTPCRTVLDDGTSLLFKYVDPKSDTKLILMIQKELESAPEPEIAIPIASAILGILLIGILTAVLWKVLINIYDKREYEKFCKEAEGQGFDVHNPLYESPTQNFVNPVFDKNRQ